MGYTGNAREGVGCSFKISGKPNMNKPLVILGNTLSVEFSSSQHARDNHALNRWGFRLSARPIYGIHTSVLHTFNKTPEF